MNSDDNKSKDSRVKCPKCLNKYKSLNNHVKCVGYPSAFKETRQLDKLEFRQNYEVKNGF